MGRGLLLALIVALFYLGLALDGSGYSGPVSDHFDGRRFHMAIPRERHLSDYVAWLAQREPGPWRDYEAVAPGPPPPRRVLGEALRVTPINHSTVLIQTAGLNIAHRSHLVASGQSVLVHGAGSPHPAGDPLRGPAAHRRGAGQPQPL